MSDSRGDPSFFRRAPSPVRLSVVSQRSETGQSASLSLVICQPLIGQKWSRNYHAPELSLQSKKIDKFNENSTASESVRRVLKKDVTMRESRVQRRNFGYFAKF